jgi:hypothetical protein
MQLRITTGENAMTHKTADTLRRTLAAIFIALILGTAWANRPYECGTDTDCEAEEAARCWILCEA